MESDLADQLLRACRLGDCKEISSVLALSPGLLDLKDSSLGWTPLHRAVVCCHEEATDFLLEQGADSNTITKLGETPLYQAVDQSSTAIAGCLLRYAANPNLQQSDGDTPLHHAACKGHVGMANLLIQNNADPNICNFVFGWTPLHCAVEYGHYEIAHSLLRAGASPYIKDKAGCKPVELAKTGELATLLTDPYLWSAEVTEKRASFPIRKTAKLERRTTCSVYEPDAELSASVCRVSEERPAFYKWLRAQGLSDLYETLHLAGFSDLDRLTRDVNSAVLTEGRLRKLGIHKSGHRRRLLLAIEQEKNKRTRKVPRKKTQSSLFRCCGTQSDLNLDFTHFPSLRDWLSELQLAGYYETFVEGGYLDVETLVALGNTQWEVDEGVLEEIGVNKAGYRHRILARLREDSGKENCVLERGESCALM